MAWLRKPVPVWFVLILAGMVLLTTIGIKVERSRVAAAHAVNLRALCASVLPYVNDPDQTHIDGVIDQTNGGVASELKHHMLDPRVEQLDVDMQVAGEVFAQTGTRPSMSRILHDCWSET